MATKTMLITALVAAVVIVAAVAVYYTMDDGSDDTPGTPAVMTVGLKSEVEAGDYYEISQPSAAASQYILNDQATDPTRYEVRSVNGDNLVVDITKGSQVETTTMTVEDYYAPIYYYIDDTSGLETATLETDFGPKTCWVYTDSDESGSTTFSTVDYVEVGTYIVYRTEITYTNQGTTDTLVKQLSAANVIVDDGSSGTPVIQPEQPSETPGGGTSGGDAAYPVRTSLEVGDSIVYTVTEHYLGGDRSYDESMTIVSISGNRVTYEEVDDDDWDRETTTVNGFVSHLVLTHTGFYQFTGQKTIETIHGSVLCDVYRIYDDRDEYEDYYIGADNDVIYCIEEYDDNRLDETRMLKSSTLFSEGSGSSDPVDPTPEQPPTGTAPSYDVRTEIQVGDEIVFDIQDDYDDIPERTTLRVTAIEGDDVIFDGIDGDGDTDSDTVPAAFFLGLLYMPEPTASAYGTEEILTVDGLLECQVYRDVDNVSDNYIDYYVGANDVVYRIVVTEMDDGDIESIFNLVSSTLFSDAPGSSEPVDPAPGVEPPMRTDVQVGDSIVLSVQDDDDLRAETITLTVIAVDGSILTVLEKEEFDDPDYDKMSTSYFLGIIWMSDASRYQLVGSKTIDTLDDAVTCDIYRMYDDDDYTDVYVGPNGIIYLYEEYDDDRLESTCTLVSSTLFADGPGNGIPPLLEDPLPSAPVADNSYGIVLSVEDTFTIHSKENDDPRTETDTYTIMSISDGRLTVKEIDDDGMDIETMSADRFLGMVFAPQSLLNRLVATEADYNGIPCQQYTYIDGDDSVTIKVHEDTGLILQRTSVDTEDGEIEVETVSAVTIQSLGDMIPRL